MESTNNGRATVQQTLQHLHISIPSKKNWLALLFGTVWLGGWLFALLNTLSIFSDSGDDETKIEAFIIIWIILWVLGGLFVIGMLLWGYFGKETLQVKRNEVFFQRSIFGLGPKKIFQASEVKNIRFHPVEVNFFNRQNAWAVWGLGSGKLQFDYGMRTYSLGLGLDDAEVHYLIGVLEEQLGK